ncbi:alpha-1,2-fucosyltransferase [Geotalea uraniireducens]|uniref:Glycosyl transferase, family 11 n=1 Tax=Geotalea uraniireducens (strain Rf4) TaxID=351605 RepID=A5GEL9_GEOUR|nr:alpha-1,2-fucosyltransferase [Geotalea uraniireducens]ABQ25874.1 glycosyl transferase, family 11 [Geotalea uraniireducens Rf4]
MIIARLQGGLGNQMFQYAVGLHLALTHNVELKIDITMFSDYKWHTYSLRPFNIRESIATEEEIKALTDVKMDRPYKKIDNFLCRLLRKSQKISATHVKEKHFHYDPDILKLPDNVYLDGYWQSEKYFKEIENIIRQTFIIKNPQLGRDKELACKILSTESVCLHIRRGNYVTDKTTNSVLGPCDLSYYSNCIKSLAGNNKDPHFFVFSNDHEWVSKNLKLDYPTIYVDHNNEDKDYEDLRLMSQCKHHIIANSTFSWWSAWLCSNPDKVIYAPQKWFRVDEYNTKDLLPSNWLIL